MSVAAAIAYQKTCVRMKLTQNVSKISGPSATHDERRRADRALQRDRAARAAHAGLPNSPYGRIASTIVSSAKVRMIEYSVQQFALVVGR